MLTRATVAMMALLSAPVLPQSETFDVQSYMPLAVGNSWTCNQDLLDVREWVENRDASLPSYPEYEASNGEVTISVLRTEVIDGETYYVLSDMPTTGWPPTPTHFIAGKKLRWDGGNLIEHNGTSMDSLYRFRQPSTTQEYTVETYEINAHGDVSVEAVSTPGENNISEMLFAFLDEGEPDELVRIMIFISGFGPQLSRESIIWGDEIVYVNSIRCTSAVLSSGSDAAGTRSEEDEYLQFDYWDFYGAYGGDQGYPEGTPVRSSAVDNTSWGNLKEKGGYR